MDTLENLLADPGIVRLEAVLGPRELPNRRLFGTQDFVRWLDGQVRQQEPSPSGAETTPLEQIDDLFHRYSTGGFLAHRREFRCVKVEKNPVWELKTVDVRIFGWFPARDCFVCVFGDFADRVKDHDLYRGYRLEIRRMRREMGIKEDLCGMGGAPSDVISF
ncbi:hypothetical protein MKK68_24435 [Methylobacterium sp. E-016]|uniref:hypothetical protein n=1 Tax=Methylobacterium sp. E-016 TaxID=2836556 RepID=UPI001FBA8277|nr:hypothetical protein [Methylobacterium sp. E-016]MCJ2078751.1 hypothetical protein [Methylobacterium sp. E-016]